MLSGFAQVRVCAAAAAVGGGRCAQREAVLTTCYDDHSRPTRRRTGTHTLTEGWGYQVLLLGDQLSVGTRPTFPAERRPVARRRPVAFSPLYSTADARVRVSNLCISALARLMPMMHHNNFVSSVEYQQSFSAIFDDLSLPRLPSFYINCPSRPAPARSAMPTSVANAHACRDGCDGSAGGKGHVDGAGTGRPPRQARRASGR